MSTPPRRSRFWIKLGLTVLVLGYVFSIVPLDAVVAELARANLPLVLGSWFIFLAGFFVAAIQLLYLIRPQGIELGLFALFRINLAAQFYGVATPFGSAASTLARWYKLSSHAGQKIEALAAMVLNRLLEFLAFTGTAVLAWWLDPVPNKPDNVIVVTAVMLGGLLIIYALGASRSAHALVENYLQPSVVRIPVLGPATVKVFNALAAYSNLKFLAHARFWLIAAVKNLLAIIGLFVVSRALDIDISFATIAWVRSITAILTFIPISIAGLGVREAGFLILLTPLGVAEADAVALGLLHFSALLFCSFLGGLSELRVLRSRCARD